jgi:hypothetical protein
MISETPVAELQGYSLYKKAIKLFVGTFYKKINALSFCQFAIPLGAILSTLYTNVFFFTNLQINLKSEFYFYSMTLSCFLK